MKLLDQYLGIVHKLEEYRETLSPTQCKSHYDYLLRVKCLDDEIEDLYFAINLMRN